MVIRLVPRSIWPKGCFRVRAWWRDENLRELFWANDRLKKLVFVQPGGERLPLQTIRQLATLAVTSDSVYDATAAMDPLFDAYESFPEIVEVFEHAFDLGNEKAKKRVVCCLGYLTKGGINRRDPLGKHYSVVRADHDHFQSFVHRTTVLATKLKLIK